MPEEVARDGGPALPGRSPMVTVFRSADAREVLREHERLLRLARPAATVAVLAQPALSYGIGVRPDAAYLRRARDAGIPPVARTTGGTGALHLTGDLLWALVLPRKDARVGADFPRAYGRLGRAAVLGLGRLGLAAEWVEAPGLSEDCCPLSARGRVLSVRGSIVGGAAQHATAAALLHQGFVSWSVDRALVGRLFGLPSPGPADRLAGVAGAGQVPHPGALADAVAQALASEVEG